MSNSKQGGLPPNGGPPTKGFDPHAVKDEEPREAEKFYYMCQWAETMRSVHSSLFPHNGNQIQKKLRPMFAPPRGVDQLRKSPTFFKYIISDIRHGGLSAQDCLGPSPALSRMFLKNCDPDKLEEMKRMHSAYAIRYCLLLKVSNASCLALETAPLLNYRLSAALDLRNSRNRWYATNLMRYPTSPQVIAAQILRNHSRLYSEDPKSIADSGEYQKAIKKLILYCPGLDRALFPEKKMEIEDHMKMSWYRIRRRVLEKMMEEANKMKPNTDAERLFLSDMPYNIRSIPELITEIKYQIEQCDGLWKAEYEGEIMLSDGPEMEDDENMDGLEEEMQMADRGGRGDMGGRNVQKTVNQSMQQMQSVRLAPSVHSQPSSSRTNQLYNLEQQRKAQQKGGGDGQSLASMLAQEMSGSAGGRSNMQWNGTGTGRVPIHQITPLRGMERGDRAGMEGRVGIRRDEHNQHLMDRTPSVHPSTTTTHVRDTPVHQTLTKASSSTVPIAATQRQEQPMQPPLSEQQTPAPFPQTGPTVLGQQQQTPFLPQSPFASSAHLCVVGQNGVLQYIPSVVYLEKKDDGYVQLTPPNPQPQLVMTIPSMGSTGIARSSSGSVKRRVSRGQQILKRRKIYADSADGSSEDSEDEKKKQRAKERRREDEKRTKEEEERREKEERERKEKEDKEEEEIRKKEEEEAEEMKKKENERIELEKVRKEEELKAAELEKTRLDEEEKKREEDVARMKTMEEARDTGVRVMTEESVDNGEEEGMVSEDEVVPESVFTQNDHKERDEEMNPSAAPTTDTVEDRSTVKNKESTVKMTRVSGVSAVPLPSPSVPSGDDTEGNEILIVYHGPGEKKQMSVAYYEEVNRLTEMKRELDEKAGNEVIYLKQTKSADGSLHSRVSKRQRGGSLDGSIRESKEEVKEEETDLQKGVDPIGIPSVVVPRVITMETSETIPIHTPSQTVKTEETEESCVTQRAGEANSTNNGMTGMTEVKSEVKEEEEEMKEEEPMIQMNASALDSFTARQEAGRRSGLEAMIQEGSTQVPSSRATTDTTSAATTVLLTEPHPMEPLPQPVVPVASRPAVLALMEVPRETQLESSTTDCASDSTPTPSPRPTPPIRVSSHGEKTVTPSTPVPPPKTRPSAKYIKILEKSDFYLKPYQERIEVIEGRVEKEKEREKNKEKGEQIEKKNEVEVIKEVTMNESDPHALRFHVMRGEAATLSEDRRRAIRDETIDSHSKAVVFTNRPLYKGERVTLKVIEISPEWKGKIRLGLTTKNPLEYSSREAIPKQLMSERTEEEREMHHFNYLYDSGTRGTVKMDTVLEVELTEKGDQLKYALDGVEMGILGGGLQLARPMWMSVDIYGFVKGMEILHSVFPPQTPLGIEAATGDHNTRRFKMEMDFSMGVKQEVKMEDLHSHLPPPAEDTLNGEQPITALVQTAVVHETHSGQIFPSPTQNLPLHTVAVESSEDTVEKPGDEGTEEDGGASEKGDEAVSAADEEVEEEDGEIVISSVEKRAIEEEVGELEEGGDQPPKKKTRIHIEQSKEVMIDKEREETVEEEEKDEEKACEQSQVDTVIGMEVAEEVQMDRVEVADDGMTEMREETVEGAKEGAVVEGMEKDQLMEDTEEKGIEGSEVTMDENEKEEIACENATVKEGEEMEESNEMISVEKKDLSDAMDKETMGMEEEKEMPLPPRRRRSLFGPGCLSFDQTLAGKMEVNEEENYEMGETAPMRRLSLFGPGSASFNIIIEKMNGK